MDMKGYSKCVKCSKHFYAGERIKNYICDSCHAYYKKHEIDEVEEPFVPDAELSPEPALPVGLMEKIDASWHRVNALVASYPHIWTEQEALSLYRGKGIVSRSEKKAEQAVGK